MAGPHPSEAQIEYIISLLAQTGVVRPEVTDAYARIANDAGLTVFQAEMLANKRDASRTIEKLLKERKAQNATRK